MKPKTIQAGEPQLVQDIKNQLHFLIFFLTLPCLFLLQPLIQPQNPPQIPHFNLPFPPLLEQIEWGSVLLGSFLFLVFLGICFKKKIAFTFKEDPLPIGFLDVLAFFLCSQVFFSLIISSFDVWNPKVSMGFLCYRLYSKYLEYDSYCTFCAGHGFFEMGKTLERFWF